jgi:riboflavin biosynthesis pyrimidine reductase
MPDPPARVDDDWRIDPLFIAPIAGEGPVRGGPLPPPLARRYGADLSIPLRADRPTIVSNFVETIDGVVAFDTEGHTGGGEVSGRFKPDVFLMGLLRATADAVLVGAGTVRSAPGHDWSPGRVYPPAAADYAAWRAQLGLHAPQPTTVIVTAAGRLDPHHAGLSVPGVPVMIVTTAVGARHLRDLPLPPDVDVVEAGDGDRVDAEALLAVLAARRFELVVCEGGPNLLADVLDRGFLDESFLTLAPQLAGRSPDMPRLAMIEGVAYAPGNAPWADLVSVLRSGSHLFLRYRSRGARA